MELIILHKGAAHTVLIDDADLELIKGYNWRIAEGNKTLYAKAYIPGSGFASRKDIYMHRLIMGAGPGDEVDHENGNGLDNRRDNLRFLTHGNNVRNATYKKQKNFDLPRGVYPQKNGKFIAQISAPDIKRHLGTFRTVEEASDAYETAYNKQLKKEI
jgi:hypothetical protein